MSIGEMIKKGFSLTNLAIGVVGILCIYNIIVGLLALPAQIKFLSVTPGKPVGLDFFTPDLIAIIVVQFLISLFLFPFVVGGVLSFLKDAFDGSQEVSISSFWQGKAYYGKLLLLWISFIVLTAIGIFLSTLLATIPALIAGKAAEGGAPAALAIVSIVFFFAGFLAIAVVVIFLFLAPYEVIFKNKGAFAAMGGSAALVKAHFGKTLLAALVLLSISILIGLLVNLVLGSLLQAVLGANKVVYAIVGLVIGSLVSSYFVPFFGAVLMAFYQSIATEESIQETV